MSTKAWQLGSPETLLYRCFDFLRRGLNRKLVRYLVASAVPGEACVVLEAGSGPAFASSLLSSHGCVQVSIAVDIDLEALQEARRRDPHLLLVVGDLGNLPFRRQCVDLVWNSSTIEHLDRPPDALAEMERVTKAGGTVFVGVPNRYGPLGFERWIRNTAAGIWIGKTFSASELSELMSRSGLEPRDSFFYFFRFFVGVTAEKRASAEPAGKRRSVS